MKKLIAISVVFALVAGVAFAADVSASVFGTANVLQGNTGKDPATSEDSKVTSSGKMNRVRIDGSGEANENFGGYFRFDRHHWDNGLAFTGNVWWKPIDQFKLMIGGNDGDGFIGKEGNTGWMFYQTPTDVDVTFGGENVWGGGLYGFGLTTRHAFYERGDGQEDVYLFITPMDMLGINVILPFISKNGQETADEFKQAIAQIDLKLDFGNIALTYVGGRGYDKDKNIDEPASIFLYFGGSFGDLSLDVGLGYHMAKAGGDVAQPIGIGVGLKYATDAFGVKFRTTVALAGEDKSTKILADVLPYFPLSDNLTAFVSVGLGMVMPESGDSQMGWHFNPYLQVGEEWGAKFLAGIKVKSNGKGADGSDAVIDWAIPVALIVSF